MNYYREGNNCVYLFTNKTDVADSLFGQGFCMIANGILVDSGRRQHDCEELMGDFFRAGCTNSDVESYVRFKKFSEFWANHPQTAYVWFRHPDRCYANLVITFSANTGRSREEHVIANFYLDFLKANKEVTICVDKNGVPNAISRRAANEAVFSASGAAYQATAKLKAMGNKVGMVGHTHG